MKKSFLAAAGCLSMLCAMPAWADGPYVGVGVGAFNIGTGVTKKTVTGGYLQAGHDFTENVGAEIRFGSSGQTGEEFTTQARAKVDYFAAAFIKPKYDFAPGWTAYGLLGLATIKGSYAELALPKQTKTRTGYAYGAGVRYHIADQFAIGAEISHMLSKPKTDAVSIRTNFKGLESSVFSISAQYYLY